MLLIHRRYLTVLLGLSVALWAAMPLLAQDADANAAGPAAVDEAAADDPTPEEAPAADEGEGKDEQVDLAKLWMDMTHYMRVARPDLAVKYGESILESGVEAREIYRMTIKVKGSRGDLIRARRLEGMKDVVDKLLAKVEQGYEDERSDPVEIARQIERLGESLGAFRNATYRLVVSGEYAVPQLIQALRDPKTKQTLKNRIVTVLPKLGKDGVRALSAALGTKSPELQRFLVGALGEIGYPHAAPRIKQLLARDDLLKKVRTDARDALVACAGEAALRKTTAQIFYDQAIKYYYRAGSVRSDPRYEMANVWYWRDDLGVTYKRVPRQIFCDVYAMRMSRLALQHDPKLYSAISLWLSAIVRREADLPAGAKDPTWPADRRGAKFHMLAASAKYQQHVLVRALEDKNSTVAMAAIEALAETSGAKSLVKPIANGAQPLVSALTYPAVRVRMLAAVSLARALPSEKFAGSDLVMPVLSQALHISGLRRAVLLAGDQDIGNRTKGLLRAAKWQVIHAPDVKAAIKGARRASGVDLIVLARVKDPEAALRRLRQDASMVMAPAAIVAGDPGRVRHLPKSYQRCVVLAADLGDEEMSKGLAGAGQMGDAGTVKAQEGGEWAIRAAKAIRTLGLTSNNVYDVERTMPALIEVLADGRAEVRLTSAGALAAMAAVPAQRAICALALDQGAGEPVRIVAMRVCTESVRRFGKMLTDEQAQGVLAAVQDTDNSAAVRDSAAQLLGSLNLPSERIESLIVEAAAK